MANTKVTSAVIADGAITPSKIASGDFYFDTDTLYIDSTNNRIGVGTASPSQPFDVVGNIQTNGIYRAYDSVSTSYRNVLGYDSGNVKLQTGTGSSSYGISLFTAGTERLTINGSGNVTINEKLTVDGIQLGNRTDLFNVDSAISKYADDNGVYINGAGSSGFLRLQPSGASNDRTSINMTGSSYSGGEYMNFKVATTERMRIDSSGSLGLGTTNPASLFHVAHSNSGTNPTARIENTVGTVAANSVLLDLKFSGDDSFSNCDYIKFQDSSGEEGVITGDGGGRVYYEITSDYRKKENIVDYTGGLNVVNNLSVKNYNMITNPNITYTGFIAHEVQEVVDGVARGIKDAVDDEGNPIYQGLDLSKLVPHLVSAIQEQQTIIDDLKARIETLENA